MKDEVINADEIVLLSAAISVELAHGMTVNQITNFANLLLMVGTKFSVYSRYFDTGTVLSKQFFVRGYSKFCIKNKN